jgi:outer membrane protein
MVSRINILALLCFLQTMLSSGQVKTVSLEEAKKIALENNISIIQSQNDVDAAQSNVLAAYGGYLPTLSASGGWNRYQNDRPGSEPIVFGTYLIPGSSGFSVQDDFRASLALNYVLFDGFSREGNLNQASSSSVSSEHLAVRTKQTIAFQVVQQYLNLLRLQQLVTVTDENLKRDNRQLDRITESNRVGALSLADVYRQQSQVAADELARINTQNDYDKAKADLVALIGLDVVQEVDFADPSIAAAISKAESDVANHVDPDLLTATQKALENRPDYMSVREVLDASGSRVTAARGGYYPIISAGAGYGISGTQWNTFTQNKTLNWGVNFQWNIFDGFNTNEALQNALAQQRKAETAYLQAERDIKVQVKKALLDIEAARKQYEVSQKGLISAAEDRRIQEERYNLGAGTLLDLLTANAGFVNAQATKVNTTYGYIIARRNLEYVIGENTDQ